MMLSIKNPFRSKRKLLSRALKQLKEVEAEVAELSGLASRLQEASESVKTRIKHLEVFKPILLSLLPWQMTTS